MMRLLSILAIFLVIGSFDLQAQKLKTKAEEKAIFEETFKKAKDGDVDSQYRVSILYFRGRGTEEDQIESAYWLQTAARQDHAQSINRLGWHYRMGWGVLQNVPEAVKLYKIAYEKEIIGASIPLAAIYRAGEGTTIEDGGRGHVKENHALAVQWARIAAEAGLPRGQNILGELYRDGKGVAQNFGTALEWFELAAQQDLSLAFFNASVIFRTEDLGYYDPEKGFDYLKKAADKGHASAMIDLALAYAEGSGLKQDYDQALFWYSKAAAKDRRSAVKLARAYEAGVFGERDYPRAYKWYFIAEKSGEVSGLVGRIAMRDRISEAERQAMEVEGVRWLEDIDG